MESVRRLACHDWPVVASRGVRVGVRWRVGEGSRGGESGVVIGRRVGEPPARAHCDRQSAPSIQAEHIEPSESGRDTQTRTSGPNHGHDGRPARAPSTTTARTAATSSPSSWCRTRRRACSSYLPAYGIKARAAAGSRAR